MRFRLENEYLCAEVESFGAELKSLKNKQNGIEYMWQGDPKYWGRTSPVLFPFVGSLKNKEYTHNGVTYPMGQHGFARDMEFTPMQSADRELWFSLHSSEETIAKYPFAFELQIGYVLEDDHLDVIWKVINDGEETMHFSIGAHPAFNCPLCGEDSKEGYRLRFDVDGEVHHYGNDRQYGLAMEWEDITLPLTDHEAVITADFFDRCTYIIDGKQVKEVGLVNPEGVCYINVTFDMPLVGIWSPEEKNAPFVCLEPWYGRCDGSDFAGELSERKHNNVLAAGETFKTGYRITVK